MTDPAHHAWRRAAPPIMTSLGLIALAWPGAAAAFEIKPQARLHLDYASHDDDAEPLADELIVRRATVGVKGEFSADWTFDVAYELASDGDIRPADGEFKDVSLSYGGWRAGELTAGQFKVPFGLDELISANDTLFIERALALNAFAPSRRMGIGFARQQDAYTFTAMLFASSIDGGDRGRGAAARLSWAPLRSADSLLHLGLALASERPRSEVDFDTGPESSVADVDLVNTGGIDDARRVDRIGLEGAWRSGPASIQSEWIQASVRRNAGLPGVRFAGWYVAGSWVLTGEARPYKGGRFKGIEPDRPTGAWELTARYSHIRLDDGDIEGGRERNLTLGLNYHFNKHIRIMLNHIQVRSERRGVADDPSIVLLRVQLAL